MMNKPFRTLDEVNAYLDNEALICLECGKSFVMLGKHLKSHDMTPQQYKKKWGIPQGCGLAGRSYRARQRDKLTKMHKEGVISTEHLQDAAKNIDYDARTDLTQASKAAHRSFIHTEQPYNKHRIAAGGQRADGRDADKARAYQRMYRSKLKQQ